MTTIVTEAVGDDLCELSLCSPNPCLNGGTCLVDNTVSGGYSCDCRDGYTGDECGEDVNECLDSELWGEVVGGEEEGFWREGGE